MSGQHKYPPLRFRPPEPERLWLIAYQEETGKPMNAILTEAVRRLQADADLREQIAAAVEAIAGNYPEDVFPSDGTSRDAIGGSAMRHAYRNAARSIRQDFKETGRCWNCSAEFAIGNGYGQSVKGQVFCSEPCADQFARDLGA